MRPPDQPIKETWLTIYTTHVEKYGVHGYAYYYRHNEGWKSYTGVFKQKVVNHLHGQLCAVGAALKAARRELIDQQINGVTVYTNDPEIIKLLEEYRDKRKISWNDVNGAYVIGLNQLLGRFGPAQWKTKREKFHKEDWLIASIVRKIYKYLEVTKR